MINEHIRKYVLTAIVAATVGAAATFTAVYGMASLMVDQARQETETETAHVKKMYSNLHRSFLKQLPLYDAKRHEGCELAGSSYESDILHQIQDVVSHHDKFMQGLPNFNSQAYANSRRWGSEDLYEERLLEELRKYYRYDRKDVRTKFQEKLQHIKEYIDAIDLYESKSVKR